LIEKRHCVAFGEDMEFEEWKAHIDAKVRALDEAIDILTTLRDSYALCSWPGKLKLVKDRDGSERTDK